MHIILKRSKGADMAAISETIDHNTLTRLVEANAVSGAIVIGQPGGWSVVVKYGMVERVLAARRGSVRSFRHFETLVGYLKGIGVAKYQVDATQFDPVALKTTRSNAAAKERLKAAHGAAAYNKWFLEEVGQAVKEADDPNTEWVSNADAKSHFSRRRKALEKKANAA